jgi:hypothetical protein
MVDDEALAIAAGAELAATALEQGAMRLLQVALP